MSEKKRVLGLKNQIADFVGDCCSVVPDEVVELEVIYPVFRVWWIEHVSKNYGPPPEGKFLRFMAKQYEPVEREGGIVFPGLIIGPPEPRRMYHPPETRRIFDPTEKRGDES